MLCNDAKESVKAHRHISEAYNDMKKRINTTIFIAGLTRLSTG